MRLRPDVDAFLKRSTEKGPLPASASTSLAATKVLSSCKWLEGRMLSSSNVDNVFVKQVISDSLEAFQVEPRTDWVKKWPGQAVLCVTQKYWTDEVEFALGEGPQVSN